MAKSAKNCSHDIARFYRSATAGAGCFRCHNFSLFALRNRCSVFKSKKQQEARSNQCFHFFFLRNLPDWKTQQNRFQETGSVELKRQTVPTTTLDANFDLRQTDVKRAIFSKGQR
jgi:hypothetical protein